jgi:hypothetical protein
VTSTRIVLADYLGRPRMLLTVRVPPACDVNGVFAAMHSPGRTECPSWKGNPIVPGDDAKPKRDDKRRSFDELKNQLENPKTPHTTKRGRHVC